MGSDKTKTRKIGRDAKTRRFIPVEEALKKKVER